MLGNEAQAAKVVKLLDPVSAANTAAATSGWVDVREAEGDVMFTVAAGAVTGSIVWKIQDADDISGTNVADFAANEGAFAAVVANQIQKRTIGAGQSRGFVRVVGTIVTGPVLVQASLAYRPKNF